MLKALKGVPELPDNLMACVEGASADGSDYVMTLDEDESMAMTEMCQWYVKKDPVTGDLSEKAVLFNTIIDAIYDADMER